MSRLSTIQCRSITRAYYHIMLNGKLILIFHCYMMINAKYRCDANRRLPKIIDSIFVWLDFRSVLRISRGLKSILMWFSCWKQSRVRNQRYKWTYAHWTRIKTHNHRYSFSISFSVLESEPFQPHSTISSLFIA